MLVADAEKDGHRYRAQEALVEKVPEAVQGISVIKSFHLGERSGSAVDSAIEKSCGKNLAIERKTTSYIFQQIVLNLFAVVIMIVTAVL